MNKKIYIISLELQNFTNEKTGAVTEMIKITYGDEMEQTDDFKGYRVMTSYCPGSSYSILEKNLKKECEAYFIERPGSKSNEVKKVITKINGILIK